jgi:hypothetical protein
MRRFHVRASTDEPGSDAFYTVAATTPVAAAMQVFFQLHDTWPEVVELERQQIVGYSMTTVTLVAAGSGELVRVEVEDRGLNA